jgi:hypothetical protein
MFYRLTRNGNLYSNLDILDFRQVLKSPETFREFILQTNKIVDDPNTDGKKNNDWKVRVFGLHDLYIDILMEIDSSDGHSENALDLLHVAEAAGYNGYNQDILYNTGQQMFYGPADKREFPGYNLVLSTETEWEEKEFEVSLKSTYDFYKALKSNMFILDLAMTRKTLDSNETRYEMLDMSQDKWEIIADIKEFLMWKDY